MVVERSKSSVFRLRSWMRSRVRIPGLPLLFFCRETARQPNSDTNEFGRRSREDEKIEQLRDET